MNTYESRSKAKTIAAVAAIVVIIGVVVVIEALQSSAKSSQQAATTTTSSSTTSSPTSTSSDSTDSSSTSTTPATTTSSSSYKDGTYTADASYSVPHGIEDIKVTLTVANGVVTDSSIVNSESDHDSQSYQEDFASEYKSSVVGKSLADLKLSYIAGASDTTEGFNDAVTQIRTQAQA